MMMMAPWIKYGKKQLINNSLFMFIMCQHRVPFIHLYMVYYIIFIVMTLFLKTTFLSLVLVLAKPEFVKIKGREFIKDSKPYYFMGTNFWYGMNLAAEDPERLGRELDTLASIGITNLRIMGSSQGPDTEPYRMVPSLEIEADFTMNKTVLEGLDLLLSEISKRNMTAVVPLNDFWHWSGGFPQYVHWYCTAEPIPYPNETVPYEVLVNYTKQFYTCDRAIEHYNKFFSFLANRVNSINGVKYKDDPTIMAWQIANEPWPAGLDTVYTKWLDDTIKYMKSVDENHLVSVGIEGLASDPDYKRNSELSVVDYLTCHLWAQNWGWYEPKDPRTFEYAKLMARKYMQAHEEILKDISKPFVLEEFGLARDNGVYTLGNNTSYKDEYYELIFNMVYEMAKNKKASGVNFWAWAGEGRPPRPGGMWQPGDPWLGDPPHEPQGWYSVYNNDSTVEVIKKYAKLMNEIEGGGDEETSVLYDFICSGALGMLAGVVGIILHLDYENQEKDELEEEYKAATIKVNSESIANVDQKATFLEG
eukprot:TRINITY_DN1519_c0_g1_i1.p1 TRINITY_DN1519_c0_g1~~TRINITY_DN1519_c0_g1_i1.p1  ORF type:complete len:532 (-),score=57.31 TRINITY_DN1519_c0_g1_i1:962-2557(-)